MTSQCDHKAEKETVTITSGDSWRYPPETVSLGQNEVHVWRASLRLPARQIETLKLNLSDEELKRAIRFHFQKDRNRFIVARGLLRTILGLYLNVEPKQVRLCYSANGKPKLFSQNCDERHCFNISHSHGLALFAVTRDRNIGIDLEYIQTGFASEGIPERFFSHREVEMLRSLPEDLQQEAFFYCWTRKEAYLKARGDGLRFPLDKCEVSVSPREPASLLRIIGDPDEASRWSLKTLSPGSGYAAALAVLGHDWHLRCWQWLNFEVS